MKDLMTLLQNHPNIRLELKYEEQLRGIVLFASTVVRGENHRRENTVIPMVEIDTRDAKDVEALMDMKVTRLIHKLHA